jgi:hypothetical protein
MKLKPEEINYIREWAKSGNALRHMGPTDGLPTGAERVDLDSCRLTREALAIARLADALEQACDAVALSEFAEAVAEIEEVE